MRRPYRHEYGAEHRAKRRALAPQVAAGLVDCARCHERIRPGQEWDLGHVDGDRLRYAGPEHRHSRDCSGVGTELRLAAASSAKSISSRAGGNRETGEPVLR